MSRGWRRGWTSTTCAGCLLRVSCCQLAIQRLGRLRLESSLRPLGPGSRSRTRLRRNRPAMARLLRSNLHRQVQRSTEEPRAWQSGLRGQRPALRHQSSLIGGTTAEKPKIAWRGRSGWSSGFDGAGAGADGHLRNRIRTATGHGSASSPWSRRARIQIDGHHEVAEAAWRLRSWPC